MRVLLVDVIKGQRPLEFEESWQECLGRDGLWNPGWRGRDVRMMDWER